MSQKTCPDCGSRVFEHGCVNCNEKDYISMQQEPVAVAIPAEKEGGGDRPPLKTILELKPLFELVFDKRLEYNFDEFEKLFDDYLMLPDTITSPTTEPVEEKEDELWNEIINNIGGEAEFANRDFVLSMLKSKFSISKKI